MMDAGEPPDRAGSGSDAPDPPESPESVPSDKGPAKGPTIIVVEHEVIVRLAVSDYLRKCGYRVLEAIDGAEAQAIMKASEPVKIAVVDVNLGPGINGFELAKWIRENCPGVRIVLTSGIWKMVETAHDLCDGPMLKKPYSHAELVDRIRRLLGGLGRRS
jgi:DNA-binding response OmpR family regulator